MISLLLQSTNAVRDRLGFAGVEIISKVSVPGLVEIQTVSDGQDKPARGIGHLKAVFDFDDLPRPLKPVQFVHQLLRQKYRPCASALPFLGWSGSSQRPSLLVCILARRSSAEVVEIPALGAGGFPFSGERPGRAVSIR